jgi:glycosyltransferase involved in cell wall biosynthesis
MYSNPLVSIITPVFNSANTLAKAIHSVLLQDYRNFELFVVDDCSADNLKQILDSVSDDENRIHYLRLDKNSGPAIARNKALEYSKGELIAFLDADDEWLPGKLSSQVELFTNFPEMDLLFTDVESIDVISNTKRLYSSINKFFHRGLNLQELTQKPNLYKLNNPVKSNLYSGNFICISSVMVKKGVLEQINGFDKNRFGTEDLDIWIRLADTFQFYYLHNVMARYNWMGTSLSRISIPRLEELLRYHKSALVSTMYVGLEEIAYQNIYLAYRSLLVNYANNWKIRKAWHTYNESLVFPLNKSLWIYAFSSFFGPFPIWVKTKIVNPLFKQIKKVDRDKSTR